ncbi:hypothetical protein KKD84_02930 [Patescibacteria group bacterium]|nr:hypothetical protein [Patescibacteria group bacterium]
MSRIIYCDICKKRQPMAKELEAWFSFLFYQKYGPSLPGLESDRFSWDLCSECSKKMVEQVLKVKKDSQKAT